MLIIYTFIISIFFSGLFYYLINFALVPYNSENVLDIENLFIVSISFVLTVASIFSFFHLIIDKLFFRKFYEKPRMLLALRRGVLLGLLLASFAWLRIFELWELHIILFAFVLALLLEGLFLSLDQGVKPGQEVKLEKEEISKD